MTYLVLAYTGNVSGIYSHSSNHCSCAHQQSSRDSKGTRRVGTGRTEGAAVLVNSGAGRTQSSDNEFLTISKLTNEFTAVSSVHCINGLGNVELTARRV